METETLISNDAPFTAVAAAQLYTLLDVCIVQDIQRIPYPRIHTLVYPVGSQWLVLTRKRYLTRILRQ